MNNRWKWVLGVTLATIVLLVLPFAWLFLLPFRMMGNAKEWYMPMMYGGPSMMFLVWLILLGSLALIGLSIVWLVKGLITPK